MSGGDGTETRAAKARTAKGKAAPIAPSPPVPEPQRPVTNEGEPDLAALFIEEVEAGTPRLQELVLALEAGGGRASEGEEAMRIAHSLKGAARIVGLAALVSTLHVAEDVLTACAKGKPLDAAMAQALIGLIDLLTEISRMRARDLRPWLAANAGRAADIEARLAHAATATATAPVVLRASPGADAPSLDTDGGAAPATRWQSETRPVHRPVTDARQQRVSPESLTRLLELAGGVVVEARRFGAWQRAELGLDRVQRRLLEHALELRTAAAASGDPVLASLAEQNMSDVARATRLVGEMKAGMADGIQRVADLGEQLYIESLRVRQRLFAQIVPTLRRQLRDAARALGKAARMEVVGATTPVDGDVLAGMESILHHLITNALDHGIEREAVRVTNGKPAEGVVRVELHHVRGELQLTIADDGAGIDLERVRAKIVERGYADAETAARMRPAEVHQHLFLAGFSTAAALSQHSGRGVGLDAVKREVEGLGGRVAVTSEPGVGTRFELTLPVTRVVVRALLIDVGGERYALPLLRVSRVLRLPASSLSNAEGRDYIEIDGENVGLVRADELLEVPGGAPTSGDLTVVLLGHHEFRCGLVIDAAHGEDDLVVQPLDPRMGRVPDVAATALLADGAPTLVLDADDLVRSIERLTKRQRPGAAVGATTMSIVSRKKRVLVVDDSLTVRETERQLLTSHGYLVEVAVDGLDAWTTLRGGKAKIDLIVADVDMPRMSGLDLVRRVRADPHLSRTPIIIVSYKDSDEDRLLGLEAGADQYFGKGRFDDQGLVEAVRDLIGAAG